MTAPMCSFPGRRRLRSIRCRSPGAPARTSGTTRQALSRLRLAAGQREHRLPAPEAGRGDHRAGRQIDHHLARVRQRGPQRSGPPDRRTRAGRPEQGVLHQRRRRGDRERDPHGPAAHRPAQGLRRLPQLPRRDRRRAHADRRPAALAAASPASAGSCVSGGPISTDRRSTPPRPNRNASARCSTCAT